MKDRAVQSIEKIKTLQSEIDKLQHSNECVCKQLHVAEEKMFESQVELQEAKQQVRSFIEEKKKTKEYYRNQMKEYQKQYDSKCREIKKLQEMLISDKQRFKKLKESMKKIIQLKSNLFEDSLTTVNSLNESTFSICSRIEDDARCQARQIRGRYPRYYGTSIPSRSQHVKASFAR
jgi:chromosome segregation ATPase